MRKLEIGDVVKIAREVDSSKYTAPTTRGGPGRSSSIGFDVKKQEMLGREGRIIESSRNGELFLVQIGYSVRNWWIEDLTLSGPSKWRRSACR